MLRTYRAYEVHLSTISHQNPKAEGLVKIMKDKNIIVCSMRFQKSRFVAPL